MLEARDSKVDSVKALIKLTESRINSMQRRLLDLTEEAATYERSGRDLPATLQRIEDAPRQEDAIHFAFQLRHQAAGWTPEQRERYFRWLRDAQERLSGGNSLQKYLALIRDGLAGRWPEAFELLHRTPTEDTVTDFLTVYIAQHNRTAPPNWDGVITLSSK